MKLSWDSLNCKHIANELVQHSNTHYLHMQWAKFCIRKLYIKRLIQTTFPKFIMLFMIRNIIRKIRAQKSEYFFVIEDKMMKLISTSINRYTPNLSCCSNL